MASIEFETESSPSRQTCRRELSALEDVIVIQDSPTTSNPSTARKRRLANLDTTIMDLTEEDIPTPSYSSTASRRRRTNLDTSIIDLTVQNDVIDLTNDSTDGDVRIVSEKKESKQTPNSKLCCPVCLVSFSTISKEKLQVMSTKCGHVFCKVCITSSLQIINKCPMCRQKLRRNWINPLFLDF